MRKIFTCLVFCYSALFAEDQDSPKEPEPKELIPLQTDQFTASFKRMLWVLFAVVILAIITVWILKKLTKIRQDQHNKFNQIKILERRTLSPKSTLYVVEIARKRILISESQLEVRKIETLPHLTELEEES
jgi:flagellar biogenesis protein FliO